MTIHLYSYVCVDVGFDCVQATLKGPELASTTTLCPYDVIYMLRTDLKPPNRFKTVQTILKPSGVGGWVHFNHKC